MCSLGPGNIQLPPGGSPCGDPGSSSSSSSLVHAGLSLHEGLCSPHGSPSSLPASAVLPRAAPPGTQVVTQAAYRAAPLQPGALADCPFPRPPAAL